ncbi:hypothetical protein O181_124506 [Austropuccinia psidii MF-1]|uniref:Uncharacterized protein n=1 Tax=Austropuccinia psidii MF-1 TaxID=1389203 RepID=A0A9Q3KQK7_9BASI|nr:hypothetical protein [Austropuccinia psidii MF-1]
MEKTLSELVIPHPWKESHGLNLTKYEFLDLLTWDGVEGNLGNQYWNEILPLDENLRESLFWKTWECQDVFNLHNFQIETARISKVSGDYIANNATWDFHWEETILPAIFSLRGGTTKLITEEWSSFCQGYLSKALKREKWKGGKFIKQDLVRKILGQRNSLKKYLIC